MTALSMNQADEELTCPMVCHFNGRYRSAIEFKFLQQAEDEITKFWKSCGNNSVLVFPPLDPHYRFLVHQLIGVGSSLQTVSIGQGRQRRTVVYFTPERELHNMAHSQSATQKTFFGRGRGRRTRRPDQALYIPGALRKAKCDQLKETTTTESAVNITENKQIPKSNSGINDDVTCIPKYGHEGEEYSSTYESKMDNPSHHDIRSSTEGMVDSIAAGIKSTSLEGNTEHTCRNMPSNHSENQRLQRESNGHKEEQITLLHSAQELTVPKNSSEALDKESDDTWPEMLHEKEVFAVKTQTFEISDQTLDTSIQAESLSDENDCYKGVGKEGDTSQPVMTTSTCTVCKDRTGECISTTAHERCGNVNKKLLSEQSQGPVNPRVSDSEESNSLRTETPSIKGDQLSKGNVEDPTFSEQKADNKDGLETNQTDPCLAVDDPHLMSVLSTGDCVKEAKIGLAEIWNGNEIIVNQRDCVNKESSEILTRSVSDFLDQQEGKAQNKEFMHEHNQSGVTLEGMESRSVIEESSSQPCSALTNMPVTRTGTQTHQMIVQVDYDGLSENAAKQCQDVTATNLGSNQPSEVKKAVTDKAELRTREVTAISVCEDAENSENLSDTLDVVSPISSVDRKNSESESSASGVGNLDEKNKESQAQTEISDENAHVVLEKTEDLSNLVVTELNENVGELEMGQEKTAKKKKRKKDKTKDLKDDKIKSKEKEEKKKKKEKNSSKDKSDKEKNLDSEEKSKKGKKSKSKEQSVKQLDKNDLNTCDTDIGKESTLHNKLTGESYTKENDDDGDGDDEDNWESNFSESGDCLNPEYLEELSRLTGIANPEVHKTQYDYYSFTPKDVELDDEDFGHILEIYNFSPELKTQDLMQALSAFRSKGFDIKWVDDTHALAIFASRHAAQDAIKLCSGPLMKLRPVSEGTSDSKKKASWSFDLLQPYKERPQTSKLLADRLVTGALGMRSKMTREERAKEREKIKEAKSKRQQEKIQKAQIWGD